MIPKRPSSRLRWGQALVDAQGPRMLLAGSACAALMSFACAGCSTTKGQVPGPAPGADSPRLNLAKAQINISPVEERLVSKAIVSSARFAFDENKVAHVFSPVTGRVVAIKAQLGEHVRKGQTLAILLSPDLGSALSDVDKARPAVTQAKRQLKREEELYAARADSQANLDAARVAYEQAVAELQRAQGKLKLLLNTTNTSNVSQRFALTAPIDGEVVARQINPGAEVQGQYSGGATQELFTIGKLDDLWVLSDVYEQDIGRVKRGAKVQIKTVAYPDKAFEGTVDWISGTLDPVSRTAKVRCVIANPERLLKPEMFATVRIETDGRKALAIPRSSIVHFGDKAMVIGVDGPGDDHFERRPVIVDEDEQGNWVPVLHGLEPHDRIVTSGALMLSEAVN